MPRKLKVHLCDVCGKALRCPECDSDRLNRYGLERASMKVQYLCRSCGRRTVEPKCACASHKWKDTRQLSKSGTICYTCNTSVKYCPHCGGDSLSILHKSVKFDSASGFPLGKRETLKCPWCQRTTTRPTCNCDLPWMSARAKERRILRLSHAKPIIPVPSLNV